MRMREWMVTVGLAIATTGAAALIKWGGAETSVAAHEARINRLEGWKDITVEKLGNMDAKLDLLLEAQGVRYHPRRARGNHENDEGTIDRRSSDDSIRKPL